MDNETAEMEALSDAMREIMGAWIDDPENEALKQRYKELQDAYQNLFQDLTARGVHLGGEATHQATRGG
jgi:hypothetical protein